MHVHNWTLHLLRLAVATVLAVLITHALTGCGYLMQSDTYTRPTLMPPSRAPAKVRVFSQCDQHGVCRKYDGRGERRYDCEREWSDCRD